VLELSEVTGARCGGRARLTVRDLHTTDRESTNLKMTADYVHAHRRTVRLMTMRLED
jgi:hypothetical protein